MTTEKGLIDQEEIFSQQIDCVHNLKGSASKNVDNKHQNPVFSQDLSMIANEEPLRI